MIPFWKIHWFLEVARIGWDLRSGKHTWESSENALKMAARKHNVNWHQFEE